MNNFFISEDFLLTNTFAKTLYHQYAKEQPIIDYHCHLPPDEIASNHKFESITSIWLAGDHYKWRAMRTLGIDEKYITGSGTAKEKFDHWAKAVPYTMRNPLYHWTHLELLRYFDVNTLLDSNSADKIYEKCNDHLNTPEFNTQSLLKKMNVKVVGTTDDPTDTLEHHRSIAAQQFDTKVLPSFRPDKSFAVEDLPAYNQYLQKLSAASGVTITSFDTLMEALQNRIEYFHNHGCRVSDHGLEHLFYSEKAPMSMVDIFTKIQKEEVLDAATIHYFKYRVLIELCKLYHQKGWVQQFHLGALRSVNKRMLREIGPDTGFDSIGDYSQALNLSKFLNELDDTNQLTKTILYNLNPSDNEVIGTMIGNFNGGKIKGKMQFGSGWWFLDQKDGMEKQINALSNMGLLSCFIGMLTDSRSFLSFPRHEYFRRILCNLIGTDVENGELPADEKWLGKLVADISYHNAKDYFGFL